MFKDKVLLITGGTGSFGNAVLRRFLKTDIGEIRIFSRDEKKQDDMRKIYNNPKLKFYIGDVRDYNSVMDVMRGVDFVFHAAALKQVPSCEFYPVQAVYTNILGTENVLNAAIASKVKKVVCLSTDKAAYPINAMGMSKALMEKVIVAKGRNLKDDETTICLTRYGNVMASRGSVIPLFIDQVRHGKPITITDPNMTRFMMSLDQAVDLVLFAFKNGKNGDLFIQKSPAATIEVLAHAMKDILGRPEHEVKIIGTRHGEKLYEVLMTKEEKVRAIDMGEYFRVPADGRDLNYSKYFEDGQEVITQADEYNSHNTYRLNEEELKKMILDLYEVQDELKEFGVK
ncbi:polysaccharide biosynthesis protein [Fusobacterium varium]|uniref:polysaccharide biosynthesis protein n=1 Tax=Fusobacterium varium TaxID=856 RepID=UPI000E40BA60|nr:polysaccharide biosynthesis protein [Fusobacterium varium]MCI6033950.1 polysaccharide biosynthesis protein [Fusobacterium varium]MDY4005715.1 polysaccharide biosynthesis protein [Fusobacterium varium]RGJ28019.1 NAD-dependent epimerase/dehydratase family protein [Fusobacterium varium]